MELSNGFGELIRKCRFALKLSVQQLADKLGINFQNIYGVESGRTSRIRIDEENIQLFSSVLGCSVDELRKYSKPILVRSRVQPKTELGKFILERRKELNLPIRDLAKNIGLSITTINFYQTGRLSGVGMRPSIISSLSNSLKCSPEEIAQRIEKVSERKKPQKYTIKKKNPVTKLGKILYNQRKKLNLPVREVIKRAGVFSTAHYHNIENGKRKSITDEFAEKVSVALEIDKKKLAKFVDPYGDTRLKKSESSFGEFIRQKRIKSGMSQNELAKKVGATRSYISSVEIDEGNSFPREETILKFAEALSIDAQALMSLKEKKIRKRKDLMNSTMFDSENLGNFIRTLRRSNRMTLADLSQKIGISPAGINAIERGRVKSGPKNLIKILSGLESEISPKFLLSLVFKKEMSSLEEVLLEIDDKAKVKKIRKLINKVLSKQMYL